MNLFATASNFTDGTNTPPAIWNGVSYVAVNTLSTLTLNRSPAAGDTISFTGSCINSTTQILVTYTDPVTGSTNLLSVTLNPTPTLYTVTLPVGGSNYFISINPGAGCTSDTATLTPTAVAPVVAVSSCQEMGRVTKAYVSAYTRNRVHESNVFAQEKRCLTADFNGALAPARTIVTAQWSCYNPTIVNMLQGEVIGRESSVVIIAQYWGSTVIRCVAVLDNGEQYTQMFRIRVNAAPWMNGDPSPATGPYTLNIDNGTVIDTETTFAIDPITGHLLVTTPYGNDTSFAIDGTDLEVTQ